MARSFKLPEVVCSMTCRNCRFWSGEDEETFAECGSSHVSTGVKDIKDDGIFVQFGHKTEILFGKNYGCVNFEEEGLLN